MIGKEKSIQESREEIERICFDLSKYSSEYNIRFVDGVTYIMAKGGYLKCHYIPIDNDELSVITKKAMRYMRKYAIKPEEFIQSLLNCYNYCSKFGYSKDIYQTVLKLDGS